MPRANAALVLLFYLRPVDSKADCSRRRFLQYAMHAPERHRYYYTKAFAVPGSWRDLVGIL
jgi:hypothetical protein